MNEGVEGYIVVQPDGNVIDAALTEEEAEDIAGPEVVTGEPEEKPDGTYAIYPCNSDLMEYFSLRNPRPIPWCDIDFEDGVAVMRIKRPADAKYLYRSLTVHPHAYHRIRTLTDGRQMATWLDGVIDEYIRNHPEVLSPARRDQRRPIVMMRR